MKKYIGLENYDELQPSCFEEIKADGFILGDPFCQRRMFRYGDGDMLELVRTLSKIGKEIIYQTPMYVTDRTLPQTEKLIEFLHDKYGVKKLLVQDIGLTDWIVNRFSDAEIIWGHWGRNRNSLMNHDFVEFLIKLGITAIETDIPERINLIPKAGLPVYAVYGNIMYNTLSRECYNAYMLNKFDGCRERECRGEMTLCSGNFKMTVDGHILGKKYQYPDNTAFFEAVKGNTENIMIYAADYEKAAKLINNLNNEEK